MNEDKFRFYNTGTWRDEWFADLRMSEQHLWNYLLTGPNTNLIGIYKITLREIAFDTGIDKDEVLRIFTGRFEPDGKAFYYDGWVIMKNWLKHQRFNANQKLGAQRAFQALPASLKTQLTDKNSKFYSSKFVEESLPKPSEALENVSNPSTSLPHNLNLNSNNKIITNTYVELDDANSTTDTSKTAKEQSTDPDVINHNASPAAVKWVHQQYCDEFGTTPNRYKLTESRRKKIATRIRDSGKLALAAAIKNTARSSWHRGDNSSGWTATLDWIIKSEEQVEKLANMEGKPAPGTPGSPLTREQQLHAEQVKRNAEAALKRKAEQAL